VSLTLYETVQRIVQDELGRSRTAEIGVVQEQHPHASDGDSDNYACTVNLRDSGLVLRRVPVATDQIGAVRIPAVGDMVLVQFIGGDLNAPVITGRLYNDEDRPPVNDDGQAILHLPLGASDDDAVLIVLHSGDTRSLTIKLGSVLTLQAQDDDPVIQLAVDEDKAVVTIDRDGAVTITSKGSLKLEGADISIEAKSGDLTLKGTKVNIN
jgi:phage baseplate assembly protein gpV